jgi:hypothetical protein
MFLFDFNYVLLVMIPAAVLSLAAQFFVRSAYSKWSDVQNGSGLTGADVARQILSRTGLGQSSVRFERAPAPAGARARSSGVTLERTAGQLTDHYDPRTHTVRMSEGVASRPSVAAMAIVAHELGHAQQHEENSILIQMRSFLIPAVQVSPNVAFMLIFAGLIFQFEALLWLGILFFGVVVLFMVLTLPVEIDASRRGLALLDQAGLMRSNQDSSGSRQVLTAAALTYVAAAITAILQLLYYISLASRRR